MARLASPILAELLAISNNSQKKNDKKKGCELEFERRLHGVTSSEDKFAAAAAVAVGAP